MTEATSWTSVQVEAAMCLWDSIDNAWHQYYLKSIDEVSTTAPQWFRDMHQAWDGHGTLGMMHAVRHVAIDIEAFWEAQDVDDIVYDWEFIPMTLEHIDWLAIDHNQIAKLKPGAIEKMQQWIDGELEEHRKSSWMARARSAAQKLWAYPQLVDEHEDDIEMAFDNGDDPETFIKAFGEKYDLTPVSKW